MLEKLQNVPSRTRNLFLGLLLLVLVVGLFIGVKLSQQKVTAPKATVGAGAATFSFSGNNTVDEGGALPVTVNVYAPETIDPTTPDGIVGMRAIFTYDNSLLQLTTDDIKAGATCVSDTPLPGWTALVKQITTNGSISTASIESVFFQQGIDGYTGASSASQTFATACFTATQAGNGSLDWDISQSSILAKTDAGQNLPNVLASSLPGLAYAVVSTTVPTATPTIDPGNPTATPTTYIQPSATPTTYIAPSATPTPTGTGGGGATNACGGTCGSNNNCNAGLYCYQGYCRAPACPSSTNCSCAAPTATPTPVPTRVPGVVYPTNTPRPVATSTPIAYVTSAPYLGEPTLSPDLANNPFLGGQRPEGVDVTASPAVRLSWFARFLLWIQELLRQIFGSR